jgi:hypothetical protein
VTRLIVPALDLKPWPTLGPEVCDWIEDMLCHGPGDVRGQPVTLTDELRLYIYRVYEVYPRGHELAGRRRFKRCFLSRRKGVGKTEVAAWLAIAELDPTAPVRCDGWRKQGAAWIPVGRPVRDPFIPMVAYTEEQADELAYGAVKAILENCDLGDEYDIGEERIMHGIAPGELRAMATAPSARDGARTSHQHIDEPHLWTEPRHHKTHRTMLNNIPKRRDADAWTHETSTMYGPGDDSVAEREHLFALAVLRGEVDDAQLLFDHRQAAETWDISKRKELQEAIKEASGDAFGFADPHSIAGLLQDLETDGPNFRRFWLNQATSTASKLFSTARWARLEAEPRRVVAPGTEIVLAFDGSYSRDSTGLVGATVEERPHLFVVEAWERPLIDPKWRTPRLEVDAAIDEAMSTWRVLELACDPPGWHHEIEEWMDIYGGDVVTRFETAKPSLMGPATESFDQGLTDGDRFTHDGDDQLARHIGNCVPAKRRGYVVPDKEHPDSPKKIDLATGAIIALARADWRYLNGGTEPFAFVWGR